jgi:hypothetical protein
MFDALSDSERITLAKIRMEKVLGHFINLAALHENNAIVVFSPTLASQIPRSYAANAFNVFQHVMYDFELVRLCATWDRPRDEGDEKESIPTVVELIHNPSVIYALVQAERAQWADIGSRNLASSNPDLSELEVESIRQSEAQFGEERASLAQSELREAISDTQRILASSRLTALRNHRDKYLAHSLTSTHREKAGGPPAPVKYDYATELFDVSIPIVEKLHRWVTGKSFEIAQSQKISRKCAEALWKGCKFMVED